MSRPDHDIAPFALHGDELGWEAEHPPRGPRPAPIRLHGPPTPCVCPAHGTEFVRWLQSALNRLQGLRLPVDGVMDAATRGALRRFQRDKGLPPDGIAGPETEQALREARRPPAARPAGLAQDEGYEFETLDLEHPKMHSRCASVSVTVPNTYQAFETAVKRWIATCVTSRTKVAGRAVHRENALVTNNPSLVNLWKSHLKDMSAQKIKIDAKYNWGPNRVESIDFSTAIRSADVPAIDVKVAPSRPEFIRKALDLLKRQKQVGIVLGPAQTPRLQCLLNGLLDFNFDDRYVSFRELWSYQKYVIKKDPRWDRILHRAREVLDIGRRHYPQDEKAILGALREIDTDIWKGIQWLEQQYVNLGSAMSPGMVAIKDSIAERQHRPNNVYACYH
jgi:hypothetical protein